MLENVKRLLGIPEDENDQDDLLNWIVESASARLKNLLGW